MQEHHKALYLNRLLVTFDLNLKIIRTNFRYLVRISAHLSPLTRSCRILGYWPLLEVRVDRHCASHVCRHGLGQHNEVLGQVGFLTVHWRFEKFFEIMGGLGTQHAISGSITLDLFWQILLVHFIKIASLAWF